MKLTRAAFLSALATLGAIFVLATPLAAGASRGDDESAVAVKN